MLEELLQSCLLLRQRSKTTVHICVFGYGIFLGIKKNHVTQAKKNCLLVR